MKISPEDALLNELEALGLIHPDWEGIDHENLPKDMRDGITQGLRRWSDQLFSEQLSKEIDNLANERLTIVVPDDIVRKLG